MIDRRDELGIGGTADIASVKPPPDAGALSG
jgi:hypothetical protein